MQESFKIPTASFPSVSGAVCSFDSQYAGLPLKSHVVQLTATQSGSGTPSPDNVRDIIGYSAIGISATNNNLWGGNAVVSGIKNAIPTATEGTDYIEFASNTPDNGDSFTKGVRFKTNTRYTFIFSIQNPTAIRSNMRVLYDDGTNSNLPNVSGNTKQVMVWTSDANKTILGLVKRNAGGETRLFYDECCLLEGVHTIDDFEAFGTYAIIDLGGTYYFGYYDAKTGVFTVTHILVSITVMQRAASGTFFYDITDGIASSDMLCNMAEFGAIVTSHAQAPSYPKQVCLQQQSASNLRVLYYNADYTYEDWSTFIANNPFVVCVECQPTTIQLPPVRVETQLTNNIFADTGDTTLQYIKLG